MNKNILIILMAAGLVSVGIKADGPTPILLPNLGSSIVTKVITELPTQTTVVVVPKVFSRGAELLGTAAKWTVTNIVDGCERASSYCWNSLGSDSKAVCKSLLSVGAVIAVPLTIYGIYKLWKMPIDGQDQSMKAKLKRMIDRL